MVARRRRRKQKRLSGTDLLIGGLVVWVVGSMVVAGVTAAATAVADFTGRYWTAMVGIALLATAPRWTRPIRKWRYFRSAEFQNRRAALAELVSEHNEVAQYVEEIRARGAFEIGRSSTGQHAHLATSTNASGHLYRRGRHVPRLSDPRVHNCSLQVVQRARAEPIRYFIKYFDVRTDEVGLAQAEAMNSSVASLEQALANLAARESELTAQIHPPRFIEKYYRDEFMARTGVTLSTIEVPYARYRFEYVSAGGKVREPWDVTLDGKTLDALVDELSCRVRRRKSAAGQRSLMTSTLRRQIKERDDYTCQQCSVSVAQEPHLLIEVDHIVPVSRGGLTTPSNLQALCWRCNRRKSDKMPAATVTSPL